MIGVAEDGASVAVTLARQDAATALIKCADELKEVVAPNRLAASSPFRQ
jgi:hypothetical protein